MVEAVQAYTDAFGCHKPSGYFLTSALVESLYLLELERRRTHPVVSSSSLESLKILAKELLHDLSLNIGSAARAYESLSEVLSASSWETQQSDFDGALPSSKCLSNSGKMTGFEDPVQGEIPTTTMSPVDLQGNYRRGFGTSQILSPSNPIWGISDSFINASVELDWDSLIAPLPLEEFHGLEVDL